MSQSTASSSSTILGPVASLGWTIAAWAGINAGVILSAPESRQRTASQLAELLLFDACGLFAIGLVGSLVFVMTRRLRVGARAAIGLGFVALFAVGLVLMREDAMGMAEGLAGGPGLGVVVFAGLVAVVAAGVIIAALAGRRFRGRRLAWIGVMCGLVAFGVNHFILRGDSRSVHLYVALAGLALAASSLSGAPRPRWLRSVEGPWARALWGIAAGATLTLAMVPPSMGVVLHQLRFPGSVVAPYVTRMRSEPVGLEARVPTEWAPWFSERASLPAIAAGPPILGEEAPIVILWTIDSLRADVLMSGEYDGALPNLARLRDRSLSFTDARSPGSQTVVTFTSVFAGTYYSSQFWSKREGLRDLWPDDEGSVRFPALLSEAGVRTVNLAAARWLVGPVGVVRGFNDEAFVRPKGTRFTVSSLMLPELRTRLEGIGDAPLFAFVHALDAHSSTRPRKRHSDPWERYIDNLALVDDGVGSLLATIEELGLRQRTILIISSDHGEAFGEHGVRAHGRTLYDELVRVPLLIHAPGIRSGGEGGQVSSTPVTLMDLGPTILDIFGLPTPAAHLGESLVPALRGEELALTRPILAEGRLKKSVLFPDGLKLIIDDHQNTIELYNLREDPSELENLFDQDDGEEARRRTSVLREFFTVHRNRREDYEAPYRK